MKTKYKHIEFHEHALNRDGEDVTVWLCVNQKSGTTLGWVQYYHNWSQYVFTALNDTMIFSVSCLQDITHFMTQLNDERANTK